MSACHTLCSPSEVLVFSKVSQQCNLAQGSARQYRLIEHSRDTLDRNRLATQCILHTDDQAVCTLPQWPEELPPVLDVEEVLHSM